MFGNFLYWQFVLSNKCLYEIVLNIIKYLYNLFSISYLFKTIFYPWKRDVIYYKNPSISDYFNMFWDNFISRAMGFIVRFLTIIGGLTMLILSIILGGLVIVIWFFLPFIIILLLYISISYMFYV